jgi:hypothetical protein
MTLNSTNQSPAHRLIMAAVAACALSAALPHEAFAATDVGIWKVDPSKSKYNANSATLTLRRVENNASAGSGSFIVISGMGVYRMTSGAHASASAGLKPVDFQNMTRTGEAVLIGTHPRSNDDCGFKCRAGLVETTRTVTFKIVNTGEQQIKDMLAADQ